MSKKRLRNSHVIYDNPKFLNQPEVKESKLLRKLKRRLKRKFDNKAYDHE